jgi:predicted amidophosphoribosyltransferase
MKEKPCDGCKRKIEKIGRLCDACLLATIAEKPAHDGRDPDSCEAAMLADDD